MRCIGPNRVLAVVAFCLAAVPGAAQFDSLVAPDDGSSVLFVTSFRQRGSEQGLQPKIFRADAAGVVSLMAERPVLGEVYPQLGWPELSGDGSIVAYSGSRTDIQIVCAGFRCQTTSTTYSQAILTKGGTANTLPGLLRLSANGSYGVLLNSENTEPRQSFIELATGARLPIEGAGVQTRSGRRVVADDGTVVLSTLYGLSLWRRDSGLQSLNVTGEVRDAAISASGKVVVYDLAPSPYDRHEVHVLDRSTLADRVVYENSDLQLAMPAVSNDGTTILYLAPVNGAPQAFIASAGGSDLLQVTDSAEGLAEATLSGNGRVVFAATKFGRMLRVDLATSTTTELIGRTPSVSSGTSNTVVPGSLYRIYGNALAEQTTVAQPPLANELGEISVKLGDTPVPIQLVSSDQIWVQIPWNLPAADVSGNQPQYRLNADLGDAAFVSDGEVDLPSRIRQPKFEVSSCPGYPQCPAIAHYNFSGIVTREHPAAAGEVVHAYMTGLGAVESPQTDGAAGPVEPLAKAVLQPHCFLLQGIQRDEMPVRFAGLAPGMIGIYQVSFKLPDRIWSDWPGLECRSGDYWEDVASWWIFTQPNAPIPTQ